MALQLQNQFLRISIQVHFSLERCAIAGAQTAFLSFKNIFLVSKMPISTPLSNIFVKIDSVTTETFVKAFTFVYDLLQ